VQEFEARLKDSLEFVDLVASGKVVISGDFAALFAPNPVVVGPNATQKVRYKLAEASFTAGFKIKSYVGTDLTANSKIHKAAAESDFRAITIKVVNNMPGLIVSKIEIETDGVAQLPGGPASPRKSRYFDPEIICTPDPL